MINLDKLKQKRSIKELLEFGIINIDKPSGPTSFDVSEFVKKKLNLRKTSHFGTLDPKVTGVLPVALNRACKLTGYFLGEDKEYVGIMRIHKDVSLKEIEKVIAKKFIGKIKQIPPVKSRVKRQEREREIKKFEILEKNEKDVLFKVECAGGTYIRKLIDDLGKELGVGAHMLELRRTRAGIFKEDDVVNLYELEKVVNGFNDKANSRANRAGRAKRDLGGKENIERNRELKNIIIPAEIVAKVYPVIEIKKQVVARVLHGSPIYNEDLISKTKLEQNKIVCAFADEQFIGMYKIVNEKKIFAKPEFVLQPLK